MPESDSILTRDTINRSAAADTKITLDTLQTSSETKPSKRETQIKMRDRRDDIPESTPQHRDIKRDAIERDKKLGMREDTLEIMPVQRMMLDKSMG